MSSKAWVIAIVAFAVVGWMGLGATSLGGAASSASAAHPAAALSASPAVAPSAPAASAGPAAATLPGAVVGTSTSNTAASMAAHALEATRAAGLKSNVVFVPRPSAAPEQLAHAAASGVVSPLYTGIPAPVGLAYYGLSGTGTGNLTGSVLNTTAVEGIVDANATGIQGQDLYDSSPDAYGIQLNAVVSNVTIFGHTQNASGVPFEYWTQNVVEYYPSSDFMVLITNVWNFTGGSYTGNEFYQVGPDGTTQYGALGYYYAETVVPWEITYPFNLSLTMTSSVTGGRNMVGFSVALSNPVVPTEDFNLVNWDYVVFNSTTVVGPVPVTAPANYTADGEHYNPIGLTNDFELDICGPGGGSQVDLSTADATLGLAYNTSGGFVSVPSAFNYGGETGETATGANVAWSSAPAGAPAGLALYGTMTTGPTLLTGLWGTGAPEGAYPVTLDAVPANAFSFLTYLGTPTFATPIVAEPAYAPAMTTNVFYLMPGDYAYSTGLSGYDAVAGTLSVAGPMVVPLTLAADAATGVYTPLWAFNNAELAALATSGSGTPGDPYLLPNAQTAPLASVFGLYNDYTFPVFPGVFLDGTNASVELYQPANFSTQTNDFQFPGPFLPALNDLQFWFWNVSGVAIVDAANISGWFGFGAWYPAVFDSFNVVFYESSHNLVAGNTFDTESQALLLFAGGTIFGPLNVGGGNNTVWGNTFEQVPNPSGCPAQLLNNSTACETLLYSFLGLGMEVAEDYDVIYNNAVATPTTAWLLPLNLYSGNPEFFTHVAWNITPQLASNVNYAAGFPNVPLTGSILGGLYQGGNYWWDYGLAFNPYNGADNPFGQLPYDENAITFVIQIFGPAYYYQTYIYPGGDYFPLTLPLSGFDVTVTEHGLLPGTAWGVVVTSVGGPYAWQYATTGVFVDLGTLPVGEYNLTVLAPTGYLAHAPSHFRIVDHPRGIHVRFSIAPGYALLHVHEGGLPLGTPWSVAISGTTPATDAFNTTLHITGRVGKVVLIDGTYDFAVPGVPGYAPSPSSGSLTLHGSTGLHVRFHVVTYAITFAETGVAAGHSWTVHLSGPFRGMGTQSHGASSTGASISFEGANGTYSYTVSASHATCSSGNVTVNGAAVTVNVTCTPSGAGYPAAGGPAEAPMAAVPSVGIVERSA